MRYFIFILFMVLIQFKMLFGQDLDSIGRTYLTAFKETFRHENFVVGNLTIKQLSENIYFEIDIVPQKEGVYFIKQTFEYEKGFGYKYNSILNVVKIGKKGVSRTFNGMEPNPFISFTGSVGDTIIIPVYWNNHVKANEFSTGDERDHNLYGKIDIGSSIWKQEGRQLNWNITNNAEELKVMDVFSDYSVHRDLREETVIHAIRFEAISPGKFILKIGNTELPIIIFPEGESIRIYVTQVVGKQWEENVTSDGLPYHYTKEVKNAILRVGDKLDFVFLRYGQKVKNPIKLNLNLEVKKLH
ncbi:MAG: hypothetical protein U0W24_00605 [Bacteroidales bacterium]